MRSVSATSCGEVGAGQRAQAHALQRDAGAVERGQRARQPRRRVELVVAVGAHQHQAAAVAAGQQRLEQRQRGRVGPLQVVEEQHQRVLRPRDRGDEVLQHALEAVLRLDAAQRRRRGGCGPTMNSISGITSASTPPLTPSACCQRVAPVREPLLAFGEQLAHQRAEGLDQRTEGHAARHLVELARR